MIEHAKPGQFVHRDNESDMVIGFIDYVSDTHMALMLFEPKEIDLNDYPDVIPISSSCDWLTRIREIFQEDPEIASIWSDIIDESQRMWVVESDE